VRRDEVSALAGNRRLIDERDKWVSIVKCRCECQRSKCAAFSISSEITVSAFLQKASPR